MEEKKLNNPTMKVVSKSGQIQDNNSNEQDSTSGKYSYEELNKICSDLFQENQYLRKQVSHLNQSVMFKRMDYLFEVLSHASLFENEFVRVCADEIEQALTMPENNSSESNNPEN